MISTTSSVVSAPSSLPPLPANATAAKAIARAVLAAQETCRDTAEVRDLLAYGEVCGYHRQDRQRGDRCQQRGRHSVRRGETAEHATETGVAGKDLLLTDDDRRPVVLGGLSGQLRQRGNVFRRCGDRAGL